MMYVKSVLAGVAALFIASVLYFYIYAFWVLPKAPPGTLAGVNVRTVFGQPLFLLIVLLAFAIGFYWEFQRARYRSRLARTPDAAALMPDPEQLITTGTTLPLTMKIEWNSTE